MEQQIEVTVRDQGRIFRGAVPLTAEVTLPVEPMACGLSVNPAAYHKWFPAVEPGLPSFARIFSPPGSGLPEITGPAITGLPAGCLPWISHKDPVPLESVAAYWDELLDRFKPATGRRFRWTYHHEAAPDFQVARDAYKTYWRRLLDVAANGYPWIEPVQIQSNYAMRWRSDTDWRDWLIEGVALGFDCYPPEFGTGYEPPESMFGLLIAAAGAIGAPRWYVPELGATTITRADLLTPAPAYRARWLTETVSYLDAQGCSGVGLWCGQPEQRNGRTYDYRPTDAATLQAYADILTPDVPPIGPI